MTRDPRYYSYYRPGRPGWSRRTRYALLVLRDLAVLVGLMVGLPMLVVVVAAWGDVL